VAAGFSLRQHRLKAFLLMVPKLLLENAHFGPSSAWRNLATCQNIHALVPVELDSPAGSIIIVETFAILQFPAAHPKHTPEAMAHVK
jgi:hypothetical protein